MSDPTREEIDEIIKARNRWLVMKGTKFVRPTTNKVYRETAKAYLRWCKAYRINAVMFLDAQLEYFVMRHRLVPSLLRLRSKKMLAQWHEWVREKTEGKAARVRSDARLSDEMEMSAPAERKLRPVQEKFKSFYVGREGLCAVYQEHTGGFNPESRYCKRCTAQASCIENGRREVS